MLSSTIQGFSPMDGTMYFGQGENEDQMMDIPSKGLEVVSNTLGDNKEVLDLK